MEIIQETYLLVPAISGEIKATIPADLSAKRDTAVEAAKKVIKPTNKAELQAAVLHLTTLKKISAGVETSRKTVGRPFLDATDVINTAAKLFVAPVDLEYARVKKLCDDFSDEELKRENEAKERLAREQAQAQQKVDETLTKHQNVLEHPKAPVKAQIKAATEIQQAENALAQVENTVILGAQVEVVGYKPKPVVKFEITDDKALYAARPEWFKLVPNETLIKRSIKKDTNLPGLKVWEGVESSVRK